MKPAPQIILSCILMATASTAVIGCKSPGKPDPGNFAWVQVQGHTAEQIRAATVVVFQQGGYTPVNVERPEMVFEKQGSKWDRIAYGSWIDDSSVWIRVRVSIVPLSDGIFRLQCQAFKVRDKGDAAFEEQVQLKNNRSKPYQALLDEVLGRLNR